MSRRTPSFRARLSPAEAEVAMAEVLAAEKAAMAAEAVAEAAVAPLPLELREPPEPAAIQTPALHRNLSTV